MNFYQKIIAAITVAAVGITLAVAWVCFPSPYSDIFITECAAIVLGELAVGATFVMLLRKSDSTLPYSLAAGGISIAYLVFALTMIYPACRDVSPKYFILIHSVGLVVAGIAYGIFALGERNIQEQEKKDGPLLHDKKAVSLQMKHLVEAARLAFPGESALLRESEKVADDFYFAADSRKGMERVDRDVQEILSSIATAVSGADVAEYKRQLEQLKRVHRVREAQAKLS